MHYEYYECYDYYDEHQVLLMQAMLLACEMPKELWPKAFNHACYICNRAYTRAIKNMTPYEKWIGKRPDISHIQEFGAPVWVLKELHQNKLDSKSKPHLFVGYEDSPSTICYYDATTKKVKT